MKVEITYPRIDHQSRILYKIRNIIRYLSILAAVTCVIVNLLVKGKAWSVVVLWSLWMAWSLLFSPDRIEFNFISQIVKTIIYVCVLLLLIDVILVHGWAEFVIPIVLFSGLIAATLFFLIDIRYQMKNSMPLIWIMLISLAVTGYMISTRPHIDWPVFVLGGIALAILLVFLFFHNEFVMELRKRFHTN